MDMYLPWQVATYYLFLWHKVSRKLGSAKLMKVGWFLCLFCFLHKMIVSVLSCNLWLDSTERCSDWGVSEQQQDKPPMDSRHWWWWRLRTLLRPTETQWCRGGGRGGGQHTRNGRLTLKMCTCWWQTVPTRTGSSVASSNNYDTHNWVWTLAGFCMTLVCNWTFWFTTEEDECTVSKLCYKVLRGIKKKLILQTAHKKWVWIRLMHFCNPTICNQFCAKLFTVLPLQTY